MPARVAWPAPEFALVHPVCSDIDTHAPFPPRSFIIGLSLGVNQTDASEVCALLIALSFHQWLEGISLASVVIRGGFSRLKGVAMVLLYSLTCPVGIAVGMGIAKTYDGESERTRGVQGAFNGVSGGMLLYVSLVQLIAEDMSVYVPGNRAQAATRMASFLALFAGAAAMCLLAVWA
ncbi:Zinc transporter 3 [Tetrabaena socialis]|uniref:Zinc transporter 3 n=1 Tax=Tetrabaena socialis TaxID=47790 RepID=A0A2J8ABH6_9CHLO|nr:Zinc transporter 3 [Tetrabaena socialis]|eukprot:PNH09823.1 Zinc transporter 3 [Tetrabaena socialis]